MVDRFSMIFEFDDLDYIVFWVFECVCLFVCCCSISCMLDGLVMLCAWPIREKTDAN